jgi:hypothetical protein
MAVGVEHLYPRPTSDVGVTCGRPRHLWDVDVVFNADRHMYLAPLILISIYGSISLFYRERGCVESVGKLGLTRRGSTV